MTLFEKIIHRQIPAKIIHEDDLCIAFEDIDPQAPVHFLLVPKKPIPSIVELDAQDEKLMGHLMLTISRLTKKLGLHTNGFRLNINTKSDGGQTVDHLHIHVLGGRPMKWPPG